MGMTYPRLAQVLPTSLRAQADADWGGCRETRKPISGLIIAINGAPIVRSTSIQTLVATSSGESEYIALFDCVKHVRWMRKFYWEMANKATWPTQSIVLEATTVRIDSSAAQALAMN